MAVNVPVLVVANDVLKDVDGGDALTGLWLVFTKCGGALNDGRRLENISWRLWHREMVSSQCYRPVTPDTPLEGSSRQRHNGDANRYPILASQVDSADSNRKPVGKFICDIIPGSFTASVNVPGAPVFSPRTVFDKPDPESQPVSLPTPATEVVSISIMPPSRPEAVTASSSSQNTHRPAMTIPPLIHPPVSSPSILSTHAPYPTVVILKPTPNPTPHPTPPATPLLPATVPQNGLLADVEASGTDPPYSPLSPGAPIAPPEGGVIVKRGLLDASTMVLSTERIRGSSGVVHSGAATIKTQMKPMSPCLMASRVSATGKVVASPVPASNSLLKPGDGRIFSISPHSDSSDDSMRTSSSSDSSRSQTVVTTTQSLSMDRAPSAQKAAGEEKTSGIADLKFTNDKAGRISRSPSEQAQTDTEVESEAESVALSERSRSTRGGKMALRTMRSGSRGRSERKGFSSGMPRGRRKALANGRYQHHAASSEVVRKDSEEQEPVHKAREAAPTEVPRPAKQRPTFKIGSNSPSADGSRTQDDGSLSPQTSAPSVPAPAPAEDQEPRLPLNQQPRQHAPQPRALTDTSLYRAAQPSAQIPRNTSRAGLSAMMQAQFHMTAGPAPRQQQLTPVKETTDKGKAQEVEPSKPGVLPPTDTVAGLAAAAAFVQEQQQKVGQRVAVVVTDSDDTDWTSADEDEDEEDEEEDGNHTSVRPKAGASNGANGRQPPPQRAVQTGTASKGKETAGADSRLTEAALEAQRQREMFQRVPKRSYADLPRTGSGLLSQLLNPDPNLFPANHPYRRGYSSGDMGKGVVRWGLTPLQQPSQAQQTQQAPFQAGHAPPSGLSTMAPPPKPKVFDKKVAPPKRTGSTSSISAAPRGFQPSKSIAASPMAAPVTAGVTTSTADTAVKAVAVAELPPAIAGHRPGLKRHHTTEPTAAAFTTVNGKGKAPELSGGYRPKGRPQELELEDDSEDDEKDAIPISKSVAQQRLEALVSRQSGSKSREEARRRSSGAGGPPRRPSPKFDDLPPWAQDALPQQPPQHRPAPGPSTRTQRQVVEEQQQQQQPAVPSPIQLAYPYYLPQHAEPSTPRTTRRMMLRTELSESLRQNVLWQRQQSRADIMGPRRRSSGAIAAAPEPTVPNLVQLKRKATSNSGDSQQQQQAGPSNVTSDSSSKIQRNKSWADAGDFHIKGW